MDKYQILREAAVAATTGPWERHDTGGFVRCVRQAVSGRGICSTFVQNPPKTPAGWESQRHQNNANSHYIAASNPATIQALLADYDLQVQAVRYESDVAQQAIDEMNRVKTERDAQAAEIARLHDVVAIAFGHLWHYAPDFPNTFDPDRLVRAALSHLSSTMPDTNARSVAIDRARAALSQ